MKKLCLFCCILFLMATASAYTSHADDPATYALDWKLADGEILAYKTAMNPIDETISMFDFDFSALFIEEEIPGDLQNQLLGVSLPESASIISILKENSRGNIVVNMIIDEITPTEAAPPFEDMAESLDEMAQAMLGTVQLRGELTPDGAIASFYLPEQEQNLVAIFFQLPTQPVQVGDIWEVDFNCLTAGNGFIAEQADKINRVTFTELTYTADGHPVAILDYTLAERVRGTMQFGDERIDAAMVCSFVGRGQFLIEEGRWAQMVGEMMMISQGILPSSLRQQLALSPVPIAEVPQEYLEFE